MDVPKGNKLSFLDEQISDTKQGVKLPEKNTTANSPMADVSFEFVTHPC
jgi:hypothetical protein